MLFVLVCLIHIPFAYCNGEFHTRRYRKLGESRPHQYKVIRNIINPNPNPNYYYQKLPKWTNGKSSTYPNIGALGLDHLIKNPYKKLIQTYPETASGKRQTSLALVDTNLKCNGFDNLINDIGIMSFVFGAFGIILGVAARIPGDSSNLISIASLIITGIPSNLVNIAGIFKPSDLIMFSSTVYTFVGIFDTLVNLFINIPMNAFGNILSQIGNFSALSGVLTGAFLLFTEEFQTVLTNFNLNGVVDRYGCNNPYIHKVIPNINM